MPMWRINPASLALTNSGKKPVADRGIATRADGVRVKNVDEISAQGAQAVLQRCAHLPGRMQLIASIVRLELGAQDVLVPRNVAQGLAQERFALAVRWRGVNQIDTRIQRPPDQPLGFRAREVVALPQPAGPARAKSQK